MAFRARRVRDVEFGEPVRLAVAGGGLMSDWLTPEPERPEFSLEMLEDDLARVIESLRRVEEDLYADPDFRSSPHLTRVDVSGARSTVEGVREQLGEHRRICAKPWEAPWSEVTAEGQEDGSEPY